MIAWPVRGEAAKVTRSTDRTSWVSLVLMLAAVAGCGSVAPSKVAPTPTPAPSKATTQPAPELTPVPGAPSTPAETAEAEAFQLPSPVCPAPAVAATAPDVRVAAGDGEPIIAAQGSTTLSTCTTTLAEDTVGDDPPGVLTARAGDRLTVEVPAGWSILAYEGHDRPARGEGANVTPLVVLAAPAATIKLPVPGRAGRSIVGVSLSIVSQGGQVVGQIEARFQVQVD